MVAAELEIPLRETEKEGRDLICKLFASIGFAFPSLYVALRMSDVHPNADCKMSGVACEIKGAHAHAPKRPRGRGLSEPRSPLYIWLIAGHADRGPRPPSVLIRVQDVSH